MSDGIVKGKGIDNGWKEREHVGQRSGDGEPGGMGRLHFTVRMDHP